LPNDGKTQLTHATSRSKLQRAWPRDDQDVTEEQAEHRVPGGRGRASGCAGVAPSKRGTAGGGCWPGQWLLGAWGGSADLHGGSLLREGFACGRNFMPLSRVWGCPARPHDMHVIDQTCTHDGIREPANQNSHRAPPYRAAPRTGVEIEISQFCSNSCGKI